MHQGSIPAWAGQPLTPTDAQQTILVYPRVGGATGRSPAVFHRLVGLSPRGRGNLLVSGPFYTMCLVYPRVGGATDQNSTCFTGSPGLSPRGRGNPSVTNIAAKTPRSIPAWAGQPSIKLQVRSLNAVYPRVGGATVE